MENEVIRSGLKSSLLSIIAQLINFLLGLAKVLVLPIILGVAGFGYWHVYLLYVSYLGLLSLGFNDGIYLRYGKYEYEDLPKPVLRSSIRLFIMIQLVIMLIAFLMVFFEPDPGKQVSFSWVAINIPIVGLTGLLIYVLQVTNQLKKYIIYTIVDKLILFVFILGLLITKTDNFALVIGIDAFSKVIVLALMAYECKEIFIGPGSEWAAGIKELRKNISVGSKLMMASLTGMLVFGLGRILVERFASVEVYGMYSFAISTINLVLMFMTAVGVVVYPTLNRLDEHKYAGYFSNLDKILSLLIFGFLIIYFPLRIFITSFMTEYIMIFDYLPVIFSIIFLQSKMLILINPFYKLLREEKTMLGANIIGLISAILLIFPAYFAKGSILVVALGTALAMGIRLFYSDFMIRKRLSLDITMTPLIDLAGVVAFVLLAYQSNQLLGFLGWLTLFGGYLGYRYKDILKYRDLLFQQDSG